MIESKYDFDLDMNNTNSLSIMINQIKRGSKVLEFGPANGRMTRYLKEMLDCKVYLVEIDEKAGKEQHTEGPAGNGEGAGAERKDEGAGGRAESGRRRSDTGGNAGVDGTACRAFLLHRMPYWSRLPCCRYTWSPAGSLPAARWAALSAGCCWHRLGASCSYSSYPTRQNLSGCYSCGNSPRWPARYQTGYRTAPPLCRLSSLSGNGWFLSPPWRCCGQTL